MNDQEKYVQFLQSIGLKQAKDDVSINDIDNDEYLILKKETTDIYLGRGQGYKGFFSWFTFDQNGKYVSHGAAE